MDISLFIERAKQLLEQCPVVPNYEQNQGLYWAFIMGQGNTCSPFENRRETIVKTMLLIKEFHGSDSPLYRWLDKDFENVEKCPVERVLLLFLEHLDTFYPVP